MSDASVVAFPSLGERAELLGAIFGDGYIQVRGKKGRKVAVTSSDDYPEWLARIPWLFESVFGRLPHHCEKRIREGRSRPHHEFYLTLHSVYGVFGVHGKHDEQGRLLPPEWISDDPELRRRFIRGLVETDGMFKERRDSRYTSRERQQPPEFAFAQKCEHLSRWMQDALIDEGFAAKLSRSNAAGVWYVRVFQCDQVRRLGEWLDSFKWKALVADGYNPDRPRLSRKTGKPIETREAEFWAGIDRGEQERWRELRELGASIVAIARHAGRSNSVVDRVVADIVPTRVAAARDLGLRPKPRWPRGIPREEVEQWREAIAAGESANSIAQRFGRRAEIVVNATRDVVWDRESA